MSRRLVPEWELMTSFLGVDVGGTKVAVASVEGNDARHAVEHPTPLESTEALLDCIEGAVREVAAKAGEPDAVGVGVPSQIEWATGTVVASVNIPLADVPLREELGRRLRRAGLRGQRRELRRARRGARDRLARARDAHARHRRGRRDRDRRPGSSAARTAWAASWATWSSRPTGPSAPGAARTAAASRRSAPAPRSSARRAGRAARWWRPRAPATRTPRRTSIGSAATWASASRTWSTRSSRRSSRSAAASRRRPTSSSTRRSPKPAARALPTLWERATVQVAQAGNAAGVIGAGLLALQEHARADRYSASVNR